MEIKDILKRRRLELGLTMLDVANAVGVSEATVSRWESGNIANMKRSRIAALAKVLQINPGIIMGWSELDETESSANKNLADSSIIPAEALDKLRNGNSKTFVLMGSGGDGEKKITHISEDEYNAMQVILDTMRKNKKKDQEK